MKISWYFDFISPFAYLAWRTIDRIPGEVVPVPVLFAGMLQNFGQLGPAEIPAKRIQTYRFCQWWADSHDIAFRFPSAHPFNPLPFLRLCIARGSSGESIDEIFQYLYVEGGDVSQPQGLVNVGKRMGISDPASLIDDPSVKSTLRENTEQAIDKGVFGVPTLMMGNELFWGLDSMDMAAAYINDPAIFQQREMARIESIPAAVTRKVRERP